MIWENCGMQCSNFVLLTYSGFARTAESGCLEIIYYQLFVFLDLTICTALPCCFQLGALRGLAPVEGVAEKL